MAILYPFSSQTAEHLRETPAVAIMPMFSFLILRIFTIRGFGVDLARLLDAPVLAVNNPATCLPAERTLRTGKLLREADKQVERKQFAR